MLFGLDLERNPSLNTPSFVEHMAPCQPPQQIGKFDSPMECLGTKHTIYLLGVLAAAYIFAYPSPL